MEQLRPALQEETSRSRPWSGASLTNAYAESAEGAKRTQFAVTLLPGCTSLAALGSEIFGYIDFADKIYAVTTHSLYSIDENGSISTLAVLPVSPTSFVRMAVNLTQIAMVLGTTGYIWNGSSIVGITDLPAVTDVTFLDGYFVWTQAESGNFTVTSLDDGTVYDSTDVANAEGAPDDNIGLIADHREAVIFGTKSVEFWYDSGGVDFPLSRQGNAYIERGCFAKESIVKLDNSVFFYGEDRVAYRLNGYDDVRVSTHAVEYALRNCTRMYAFTYAHEGHKFYVLNTDVGCWAYDVSTQLWHRRKSRAVEDWNIIGALQIWKRPVWIGRDGNILLPDFDVFTENGSIIEFQVDLPTIESRGRTWQTLYAFEALFETGVGNDDAPDPIVQLTYSKDGGRSYSSWLERKLGAVGEYVSRAIWRKLGKFRQINISLRCTDPVRRFVMAYWADIR